MNIVLVVIFGLFFSHRMAGPIYRIKKFLSDYLDNGDLAYLKLRKKDYFQDIAALLNKAFNLQKEPEAPIVNQAESNNNNNNDNKGEASSSESKA